MELHFGEPRNDLQLLGTSGWTNTLKGGGWVAHQFYRHITWWIGISWRGQWFVGCIRTGPQGNKTIPDDPPSVDKADR